jgi:hypothetical protein
VWIDLSYAVVMEGSCPGHESIVVLFGAAGRYVEEL